MAGRLTYPQIKKSNLLGLPDRDRTKKRTVVSPLKPPCPLQAERKNDICYYLVTVAHARLKLPRHDVTDTN